MANIQSDINDSTATVSVNTHRLYDEMIPRWEKVSDTMLDEYQIKVMGDKYLPVPSGIAVNPDKTQRDAQYLAYVTRAIYYAYLPTTIGAMMGLLTRKPTQIEIPKNLEGIIEKAGFDGDNLQTVMNRTLENQLSYSRYGILLDVPENAIGTDVVPFMAEYLGDKIVNWAFDIVNGQQQLVAVVLNESYYDIGTGFNDEYIESYRIAALDYKEKETPVYYTYKTDVTGVNDFTVGQSINDESIIPNIRGNKLSFIPFQPFNAMSLEMSPEIPVLMQLIDISLAIYRGEADYRSALFMQGQATPYIFGANKDDADVCMGANTMLVLNDKDAKAGFMEVSGSGLGAQEKALNDLHSRASEQGVSLVEGSSQESGEALNIRVGVKTASLTGVAKTNAMGFKNLIQWSAEWTGANKDEVSVVPNVDFSDKQASIDELVKLTMAVEKGLFLMEDFYNWLVKNEMTTTVDYETWKDELESSTLSLPSFVMGSVDTEV